MTIYKVKLRGSLSTYFAAFLLQLSAPVDVCAQENHVVIKVK